MAEFASKGVAGSGLGLGIAGTALGLLNGGLGNLFGNNCMSGCSENHIVNRYELGLVSELNAKDGEIALLKADKYTDQKIVETYKDLVGQINAIKENQNAINMQQAVYNGTNNATINCLQGQINALQALTKTIIPITNVCPQPMPQYNSWTAPTTTTPSA